LSNKNFNEIIRFYRGFKGGEVFKPKVYF